MSQNPFLLCRKMARHRRARGNLHQSIDQSVFSHFIGKFINLVITVDGINQSRLSSTESLARVYCCGGSSYSLAATP